jgi:hypothetical protein
MSDEDSGVEAGSGDSNGSLSMSVGSSASSDIEEEDILNEHPMQGAHVDEHFEAGVGGGADHINGHALEEQNDLNVHENNVVLHHHHHNHAASHPNEPSTSGTANNFELSWQSLNIAGVSFSSPSFNFYQDWAAPENHQHDYSAKMKVSQRKPLVRNSLLIRNQAGEKKLWVAANNNELQVVLKLLDEGVNPKSCDSRQRTALHLAASKGSTDIANALLERGADPNQRDLVGNTPLHLAACTNHTEMVTLLLKAGTDINAIDNSGRTPLHMAQSKLKLLQQSNCENWNGGKLKAEVLQVVEMMQIYLQRSGKTAESDMLSSFSNRLNLHQTKEEVDVDVQDLLNSLDHLSLQKNV